jgi:hypothetical protein
LLFPNELGTHPVWPIGDSFSFKDCLSARHEWSRQAAPF